MWAYVLVLVVFIGIVYGPDVGRAFIKDDFGWVVASRVRDAGDLHRLFVETRGFYRPLVSLTFAANERLSGNAPFTYGLTNLVLAAVTALAVGWFARSWRLPPGAALFAGAAWLLNVHGINMAVLWISGRTALLLTLFACLAAVAASKGRPMTAAALAFLALLSKEEAILLPIPLLAILYLREEHRRRDLVLGGLWLAIAVAAYYLLRAQSDALTPANAPPYYRFTLEAPRILRNIREYADRAGTFTAVLVALTLVTAAKWPKLTRSEIRLIAVGFVWLGAGFGITTFLPVRSSLYACFPSVGVAQIGAAVTGAAWREMRPDRQRMIAIVALLLPFALIPVYKYRNTRWVELAVLSSSVTPTLKVASEAASDGDVVLVDDRSTRVSLSTAYDALIADAVYVASGQRRRVWLVPPSGPPSEDAVTVPKVFLSVWRLRSGHLERIDGREVVGLPAEVLH